MQVDEENKILILEREEEGNRFVCVINFSSNIATPKITLDASYKKMFDSSGENWRKQATDMPHNEGQISIQPESILIFGTHNF